MQNRDSAALGAAKQPWESRLPNEDRAHLRPDVLLESFRTVQSHSLGLENGPLPQNTHHSGAAVKLQPWEVAAQRESVQAIHPNMESAQVSPGWRVPEDGHAIGEHSVNKRPTLCRGDAGTVAHTGQRDERLWSTKTRGCVASSAHGYGCAKGAPKPDDIEKHARDTHHKKEERIACLRGHTEHEECIEHAPSSQ